MLPHLRASRVQIARLQSGAGALAEVFPQPQLAGASRLATPMYVDRILVCRPCNAYVRGQNISM